MIRYVSGDSILEKSAVRKMMADALTSDDLKMVKKIERYSDTIADLMGLVHGGDWIALIDHQAGMVLVRRCAR